MFLLHAATLAWVPVTKLHVEARRHKAKHSSAHSGRGLRGAGPGALGALWGTIVWLHSILIFSVVLSSGEIGMFSARILSCCFYSQNSSRDFSEYP